MTKKLVVTDYNFPSLDHESRAAKTFDADFETHHATTTAEVVAALCGANVGLVQFAPVNSDAIAGMAEGAVLIRYGVGYDNIDTEAARAHGVKVAYVPDYCAAEVADHTVAMLLATLRKLARLDATTRDGSWGPVQQAAPILPFEETVIGFLGLGRIGLSVKRRLEPFGFRFLVSDPFLTDDVAREEGVEKVSLEDLAERSDALSLHAPLTADTRHVVNAGFLARMRPGAVIVNSSRGELIDTVALAISLSECKTAGAALDVFELEPLEADHPLRSAPNLLISPHAAWYSTKSIDRLQRLAAEEALRALREEQLRCPVSAT